MCRLPEDEPGTATTLHPLGSAKDRRLLDRLWQLYAHDLSEFRGSLPDDEGLFKTLSLRRLVDDPHPASRLIRHHGSLVGFALVTGSESSLMIAEFFVLRAVRRAGVGRDAARSLLAAHPGAWEIAFQEANAGAARFWRQIAIDVAPDRWTEELRPVPGKPEIAPDVWLMLTVIPGQPQPSAIPAATSASPSAVRQ